MNEKVEEYLLKKDEAIRKKKQKEKEEFLISQGFWVGDLTYPNHKRPLDITDEEYELMKAAYEKSIADDVVKEEEKEYVSMMTSSKLSNPGEIVRSVLDGVLIVIFGIIYGAREYIADEYNPQFDVKGLITYFAFMIAIEAVVMSAAYLLRDFTWIIRTRKEDKKQR